MSGNTMGNGKYHYYGCTRRTGCPCKTKRIRAEHLHALARSAGMMIISPDFQNFLETLQSNPDDPNDPQQIERRQLETQLQKIEKQISNGEDAILQMGFSAGLSAKIPDNCGQNWTRLDGIGQTLSNLSNRLRPIKDVSCSIILTQSAAYHPRKHS